MTVHINEFFNQGVLLQAFQAERNILIWQYIGEEKEFLKLQDKYTKDLYSFIQQSAQTNFILSLGKLFDKPDKKFPTRCILSFLKLLDDNSSSGIEIIETTNTIKLLREYNCPSSLIDAVINEDKSLFPKVFAEYYFTRYNTQSIKNDIEILRLMRNKAEAHNEAVETLHFGFETSTRLLNFATELIAIFGMAYHSTVWKTENFSFIKTNAERNAYFIKSNIAALKNT